MRVRDVVCTGRSSFSQVETMVQSKVVLEGTSLALDLERDVWPLPWTASQCENGRHGNIVSFR
jgi:hypothetical protein